MNSRIFLFATLALFFQNGFAQKKRTSSRFFREVTIKDSITISLIDQYIEKIPERRVLSMAITTVKDSILYRFSAIATADVITDVVKPVFVLQHKGYYVLITSGMANLVEGDQHFANYLAKKLATYLEPGSTTKNRKDGSQEINLGLIYDPPIMFATYSRNGVKIRWDSL